MQLADIKLSFAKLLFSTGQRKKIYSKLSKLMKNGVPILQALDAIYGRSKESKGEGDSSTIALKAWMESINNGASFSDSIADWVPEQEYLLILSGEDSGQLESSLMVAIEVMESLKKIKGAVLSGVLYPFILVSIAVAIAYMFGTKLYPAFLRLASEDKWDGIAVYAFKFSHFINDWLFILIAAVAAVIAIIVWSLPRWDTSLRIKADRMLPYSLYRIVIGSTWLISLSAMIGAGKRVQDALISTERRASPWLKTRIRACRIKMGQGYNMGEALTEAGHDFPDKEIVEDLGIYASISGLDEALEILGRESSTETIDRVNAQAAIAFVFGLAFVTALLGFLISGLISMQLQIATII